jgi:hypothetical protein
MMTGEINGEVIRLVEPLVNLAWKAEYKARTDASSGGSPDDSSMAGVATAGAPAMPWDLPSTNPFGQDPAGPTKAPWE